ncbi:MAG: hypothetical protein Q7S34_03665 [bacterium]|nr:hypothetical protein [bacterium]
MNKLKGSALVIFEIEFPDKKREWWQQFSVVIAPKQFKTKVKEQDLSFIDIESLIDPGSVQEAAEILRKLSFLKVSDGRRLSKIFQYKGYELWWINYDDLMNRFCLPYTQYRRLLNHLKSYSKLYIYKPPFAGLFQNFLDAHNCQYVIENQFTKKLPFGILLQVVLSTLFLLWIKIRSPKLMVWTSDFFDLPRDHDFRMKFIYEELYKKKINFVEFIRSMESSKTLLRHALRRKRPVIYSFAIGIFLSYLAKFFSKKYEKELNNLNSSVNNDPMEHFWFLMATNYLHNVSGNIWAIRVIKSIIKFIGIKTAIIIVTASRNFPEVLACKLLGIKTTGIQHGLSLKHYAVSDFMPEFNGERHLSVDKYGLWSEWWREYYIRNSKTYQPRQLYVSGPMRPLQSLASPPSTTNTIIKGSSLKVLFVSEQLGAPSETLPYLQALIEAADLSLYLKFRSYSDGFENWLKENKPDILEKIDKSKIFRGSMQEAIAECDVVVGSHSTGVMEAALQFKPPIFFLTKKWGDFFELKSSNSECPLIAENPQELLKLVKESGNVTQKTLRELQLRFFGDSHKNGSKWVVEQVEEFL